jgi:hypothetical protein
MENLLAESDLALVPVSKAELEKSLPYCRIWGWRSGWWCRIWSRSRRRGRGVTHLYNPNESRETLDIHSNLSFLHKIPKSRHMLLQEKSQVDP